MIPTALYLLCLLGLCALIARLATQTYHNWRLIASPYVAFIASGFVMTCTTLASLLILTQIGLIP